MEAGTRMVEILARRIIRAEAPVVLMGETLVEVDLLIQMGEMALLTQVLRIDRSITTSRSRAVIIIVRSLSLPVWYVTLC
jgi:hypothetical protein